MKTDLTVGVCIIHDEKAILVHHTKLDLWLLPGGHIEKDETPDEAVKREALEEVGLEVEFIENSGEKVQGEIDVLATPFYVNLHSVVDHNHVCFYYLCKAKHNDARINSESKGFRWLTQEEIKEDNSLKEDLKKIALLAFDKHHALRP